VTFLDMDWVQNITVPSLIGAPEVVRHDVKCVDFSKLAQLMLTNMTKLIQNK